MSNVTENGSPIMDPIGEDGMFQFYRCSASDASNKSIILKCLFDDLNEDSLVIARLRNSLQRFLKPIHPSVTTIQKLSDEAENFYYIVEDFSDSNLKHWGKIPRTIEEITNVLLQVANGILALHETKIIHRNLRSELVLISSSGEIKICESVASAEFAQSQSNGEGLSEEIDVFAPEYLIAGEISASADIYSFGVLAYELLTGKSPVRARSLLGSLKKLTQIEIPSPKLTRKDCPQVLADLVQKACDKRQERRQQSIEEIIQGLQESKGS